MPIAIGRDVRGPALDDTVEPANGAISGEFGHRVVSVGVRQARHVRTRSWGEGLAIVAPPEASKDGGAHLSYPLIIPKGPGIRLPALVGVHLRRGNGCVGQGWDLSVGEIRVDTRWGAPYFDPDFESETYSRDGDSGRNRRHRIFRPIASSRTCSICDGSLPC